MCIKKICWKPKIYCKSILIVIQQGNQSVKIAEYLFGFYSLGKVLTA